LQFGGKSLFGRYLNRDGIQPISVVHPAELHRNPTTDVTIAEVVRHGSQYRLSANIELVIIPNSQHEKEQSYE
jgi:hypothetical protein